MFDSGYTVGTWYGDRLTYASCHAPRSRRTVTSCPRWYELWSATRTPPEGSFVLGREAMERASRCLGRREVHQRAELAVQCQSTYLIGVPGSHQPEFMQMLPFTPRNRDNLIGLMMARCDGEHLGEKIVLLLSKQQFILGPIQVDARINQDEVISNILLERKGLEGRAARCWTGD